MPDDRTAILMIRPTALGDVARTVGCLVTLRQAYPQHRIDWLVSRPFVDAVAHHPALDRAIPFDRGNLGESIKLAMELRKHRYERVYDLQGLARSGLFTLATGAGARVGFRDAREGAWLAYNRRYRVEEMHTVRKMLGLLQADGLNAEDDLRLFVPPDAEMWWADAKSQWASQQQGCVVLAPTAQWGCKCWPIERYAELAGWLIDEELTQRVIVVAGPHEMDWVEQSFSEVVHHCEGKIVFPRTTVGQSMAVIAGADLVVCNDSAPLHLAVGLDRPTVSLFGPTDPAAVGPYDWSPRDTRHLVLRPSEAQGQTYQYRRHRDDDTLIRKLSMERVRAAVLEQLTIKPTD